MFIGCLAPGAPLCCGLHQPTLRRNRLTAIRAVAVDPVLDPMQSGFHLGHFVDVALLLRTAKVRGQALRHLVLAIRHLIRGGTGRLSLNLLGGLNLRAQFQPAVGQQIAYFCQSDFVWRDPRSVSSIFLSSQQEATPQADCPTLHLCRDRGELPHSVCRRIAVARHSKFLAETYIPPYHRRVSKSRDRSQGAALDKVSDPEELSRHHALLLLRLPQWVAWQCH